MVVERFIRFTCSLILLLLGYLEAEVLLEDNFLLTFMLTLLIDTLSELPVTSEVEDAGLSGPDLRLNLLDLLV
ncbi:hypothetical protein D3C81_1622560 [compost metagenome]